MEHHSNIVPWHMTATDTGAKVRFLPVTDAGELDYAQLGSLVTDRTKLVCVSGMSNVLGTINHVDRIVAAARAVGALVLVDGAQLVPHSPVDFQALGADFLAFSSHKMLGPTGVGALVARPELLEEMDPFLGGGEMIRDVTLEGRDMERRPVEVRGRDDDGRRGRRLRGRDRLPDAPSGWTPSATTRSSSLGTGSKALADAPGVVVYGPTDPGAPRVDVLVQRLRRRRADPPARRRHDPGR